LQPLGLAFFNSISKFLTIYYLEIFQACSQLVWKNESKEAQIFWTFFHTNVTL